RAPAAARRTITATVTHARRVARHASAASARPPAVTGSTLLRSVLIAATAPTTSSAAATRVPRPGPRTTAIAPTIVSAVRKKYAGSFSAEIDHTKSVGMNSSAAKPPSAASGPKERRAVRYSAIAPVSHIAPLTKWAP